jgi:hypothetical protein
VRFFDQLGSRVLGAWHARDFDERIFQEVAEAELTALRPSDHVSPESIVEWVHEAPLLPRQGDLKDTFGSPPIIVYANERFYIQALFWVDGTTQVHQHGFTGAFHVLEGSSLHSTYEFKEEHRYSDRLMMGKLDFTSIEHLRKGDVRVIRPGAGTIHALFHLDRPSVSIVVRTNAPCAGPQYSYLRNGIAYDPFFSPDSTTRKVQTLELLKTLGRPVHERALRSIQAADAFTAFELLRWFRGRATDDEYTRLLDELRSPHTELLERIRLHRDEARREDEIVQRRERIRSAEHRFFLALLLNVPSRAHILALVRAAYPGVPPLETVVRWVSELAGTRLDDGRDALDMDLTPSELGVLTHVIEGATDDQVIARLRETPGDVEDREVRDFSEACRDSTLFRPLFRA